jgi:probable phosphoglycerate mutase
MLVYVRHGVTSFNDNGGKGGTNGEKFRGWLPIALTLEGMAQAHETAADLAELEGEVYALYSSDVVRAVQTAQEVAEALWMPIEPREELRDWNLGDYVGQPVEDVLDEVLAHIDDPNKVVKGGESYQTFLDRTIPFLKELVESDEICVAVSHARNSGVLKALSVNKGKHPDTKTLKAKSPILPGGVMIIGKNWDVLYSTGKWED